MNLTAEKVNGIFMECLFKTDEGTSNYIHANGVITNVGFNHARVVANKETIISLLNELPDDFKTSGGGGMSFLNACFTKDGAHWGEHSNIDRLICLGIAIDKVSFPMSRDMWSLLPGGMPYFTYNDN